VEGRRLFVVKADQEVDLGLKLDYLVVLGPNLVKKLLVGLSLNNLPVELGVKLLSEASCLLELGLQLTNLGL
jgi:hypothetical protein